MLFGSPIYYYRCDNQTCSKVFEVREVVGGRIGVETGLIRCPYCRKRTTANKAVGYITLPLTTEQQKHVLQLRPVQAGIIILTTRLPGAQ